MLVELHIFAKHRIPRLMASRNCEVMLNKTLAAHCLDDKSRAFLVIGIGATNMNHCPIFSSSNNQAQVFKPHFFGKLSKLQQTAKYQNVFLSKLRQNSIIFDRTHSSKSSILSPMNFQVIETELSLVSKIVDSSYNHKFEKPLQPGEKNCTNSGKQMKSMII